MSDKTQTVQKPQTPPQGANGAQPAAKTPDATRVRKPRSTPLQTMARIEDAMNDLTDEQRRIVCQWFTATYDPKPEKA